jgi:hypothetical protein
MAESELELRINYDGRTVVRELKHTDEELKQMRDDAVAAGTAASEAFDEAGDAASTASRKARGLRRQLDNLDGSSVEVDSDFDDTEVRQKIAALEQEQIDVEVDAERSRRRGGRTELGTEPEDIIRLFAGLPPQIQALVGALLTASAALAGGAGLAAAATVLANTLGDEEIQGDLDRLKMKFRGVGAELAEDFEPVIRNQVIPAAESLANAISDSSKDLAEFSDRALQLLQEGNVEGSPGNQVRSGASAFAQLLEGQIGTPDSPIGQMLGLEEPLIGGETSAGGRGVGPGMRQASTAAEEMLAQLPGDALRGMRQKIMSEVVQPALQEIAAIRERRDAGLISAEEETQKIKEIRNTLDKELRMARQKNPPTIFPDDLIQENLRKLNVVGAKLEEVTKPPRPQAPIVEPENELIEQPEVNFDQSLNLKQFTGVGDVRSQLEGGMIDSINKTDKALGLLQKEFDNATTAKARKDIQRLINRLRDARGEMQNVLSKSEELGGFMSSQFQNAATSAFMQLGQVIGDTQKDLASFGQAAKNIIASLAQAIGKKMIAMGTAMVASAILPGQQGNAAAGAAYIAAGTALTSIGASISGGGGGGGGSSASSAASSGGGRDIEGGGEGRASVPGLASGGRIKEEGIVLVGEEGPEAVSLPAGAEVMRNQRTRTMLNSIGQTQAGGAAGGGGGSQDVNVQAEMNGSIDIGDGFRLVERIDRIRSDRETLVGGE